MDTTSTVVGLMLATGIALNVMFPASVNAAQNGMGQPPRMGQGQDQRPLDDRPMIGRSDDIRAIPGIQGAVTAINGTALTVSGEDRRANGNDDTKTTYTVDASNATVMKGGATSTLSAIAIGDTVMVQGTVTGTTVIAKFIHDGVGVQAGPMRGERDTAAMGTTTRGPASTTPQMGRGFMSRISSFFSGFAHFFRR